MRAVTIALATFFTVVQFYTSLARLSPTPPVGYVFASRSVAIGLVALLVLAAAVPLGRLVVERAPPARASTTLLGYWIGSAALSSALGIYPAAGFAVVGVMLLTGCFHIALVHFYPRAGVAAAVVATFLGVGLFSSVAALAMTVTRRPALLWALNHGRAAGFFVTANQFAAFLIVFIFIGIGTAGAATGLLRRLGAASTAVGTIALLGTVSVAGILGALCGGIFYCVALRARRAGVALALVAAVGGGALFFGPAVRHNAGESLDRIPIWRSGVRVAELFPLTGVGPMAYYKVYPVVRAPNGDLPGTFGALHPHDVYLSLAGETGLVGLAATAAGWLRFGHAFRSGVRGLGPRDRAFAMALAAGLVAVLVHGLFDTVGVVETAFVWIPCTALALAAAASGLPTAERVAA